MKKLIASFMVIACSGWALAGDVTYSSFTATNDTLQLIRPITSTNTIAGQLCMVIVSSPSTIGLLKIYNSTWTSVNQVASITLATPQSYIFGNVNMKGLTYTTTSNTGGVTIIYKY